ncbi:MAG: hypothetical protein ACK5KN_06790 [Dysgonomonas sp.]|jgi:hypothetical protein|uniref:hypothetical protein n=1 Tax=unclassified Dysgonomonas TaxID=2630389 RepID=UPI0025C0CBC4|nr:MULTISPECIES: hypothetical protein [unclassified Dysgonomonas]MDR1715771.1 hypothetical protein [Prevotella sp.]MDR2005566.1 hypothetical protein [Prevotella sp.]HMM02887.1 hypothetical protein [Dysgonomonas sp.]
MKKLVLFAVAVIAISFASCGNKAAEEAKAKATADSIAAVQAAEEAAAKAKAIEDSIAAATKAIEDSIAAATAPKK